MPRSVYCQNHRGLAFASEAGAALLQQNFCGRGLTPLLQRVDGAKAARLVALTVVSMEPPDASPNQEQIEP